MASHCYASIKGLAMRATRLDGCGNILSGSNASVVSCGFVSIQASANIEEGEEFTQKLANGDLCVSEKDQSVLKFLDLTFNFCEVDPELYELITGNRVVSAGGTGTGSNDSIGFTLSEDISEDHGFALEVWTRIAGTGGCGAAASYEWIYWLMPNVVNGTLGGDITIENGPMTFTLSANTKTNPNWLMGPYNVFQKPGAGAAGKLPSIVASDEHLYVMQTNVEPPACACGYQTL